MRESNRTQILDAAARVVQREGIASVTYETVAAEAGLTKGGLVYHFPSRESLILAAHQRLAEEWEASMAAAITTNVDQATENEKLRGYARAATQSATRPSRCTAAHLAASRLTSSAISAPRKSHGNVPPTSTPG